MRAKKLGEWKYVPEEKLGRQLGISTPEAASIALISDSTCLRTGAGLGHSIPFIGTGFHIPRVTSAEK